VILDEAEALLDPVSDIDGFMLACLVDASTGMVLASRKDQDDISLPTAAAGAADIANVLSLLAGQLPVDGLEDVMVTFRRQLYMTGASGSSHSCPPCSPPTRHERATRRSTRSPFAYRPCSGQC